MDVWGSKLYYVPDSKVYDKLEEPGISSIVQSTMEHVQHANTRVSEGMPLRKILKIRCSEIEIEDISESKYLYNVH